MPLGQFTGSLIARHEIASDGSAEPLEDVTEAVHAMVGDWARLSGQCLGVFDLAHNRLVHAAGDDRLLPPVMGHGDLKLLLDRLHPDEVERVAELHLCFLDAVDEPGTTDRDTCTLVIDHQLRRTDGDFARVLRHILPFAWTEDGRVRATLHLCRDMSAMLPISKSVGHVLYASEPVHASFHGRLSVNGTWHPAKRQLELLQLLAKGCNTRQSAAALGLSTHTVSSYRRDLLRRCKLPNVAALIQHAARVGWLSICSLFVSGSYLPVLAELETIPYL